jgi:baseplate J-like protein
MTETLKEPTKEQIIKIEPDDEIATIRDRITWAEAPRVLLVVSRRNKAMRDKMNLKLVQRTAIDQAIQIALVAHHRDTVRLAEEIGLPVFWMAKSPLAGLRSWNAGGEAKFVADEATDSVKVIAPSEPRFGWKYRVAGMSILALFVLIVAGSVVAITPSARIVLSPVSDETTVKTDVSASVSYKGVSTTLRQIPARIDDLQLDGVEQIAPIAKKDFPDAKSVATVSFTNRTDQAIHVPKGSFVATSGGVPIRFQTNNDADIPPKGRADIAATAVEPGPNGNVAKFAINIAEGSLSQAVNVINANAASGGTVKRAPVVSDEDKRRVEEVLIQRLRQEAVSKFQAALKEDEFVPPETVTVTLDSKTFDKFVDEQADLLTLSAHATARGLIVNGANANLVALEQLRSRVRPGFELLPDSIVFTPSALLQADTESIRFEMIVKGQAAAAIDRGTIINTVRGMKVKDAADWLSRNLSLTRDPQIDLRSDTFSMGRIPLFAFRIQVDVAR